MAEVVFRWLEIKRAVKWVDVATLCEQTGFNHISEAINNAYISGMHDAHISFAYLHSSRGFVANNPSVHCRHHHCWKVKLVAAQRLSEITVAMTQFSVYSWPTGNFHYHELP